MLESSYLQWQHTLDYENQCILLVLQVFQSLTDATSTTISSSDIEKVVVYTTNKLDIKYFLVMLLLLFVFHVYP